MNGLHFYKMEASGNDFIVMDNRKKSVRDAEKLAAKICPPHTGVGADGLLLIEPSKKGDFFLKIINADGSEAEACGNGYRCVARFAHEALGFPKKMKMETLAGPIEVEVKGQRINVLMAPERNYTPEVEVDLNGRSLKMDFINTGVPHVVIFSEGLDELPLISLGPEIRYHKRFRPKGTNVNLAEVRGKHKIRIRTYERGVEDETLACGTGSVAAALCGAKKGYVSSPVDVLTKSGDTLRVYFSDRNGRSQKVYLEGDAKFVFEGKLLCR